MSVDVSGVTLRLGDSTVLDDVSIEVPTGERRAIMGPSGAGKSSLLRVIAGLERPQAGTVTIDGVDVSETPTHRRRVGLMFQDDVLFPHLDVRSNVAYGLRMQGVPDSERNRQADRLLATVGLDGYGDRNVASLSGGEAQRVALARTLAPDPRLVLFDEPMGAVDQARKDDLIDELKTVVDRIGITSIYVTHDRIEAETYADRITVLADGRVVRTGTSEELWHDPRTPLMARLMGRPNVVSGAVVGWDDVTVVVPLDAVTVEASGPIRGIVLGRSFRDGHSEATVEVGDARLRVRDVGDVTPGESIRLTVDEGAVIRLAVDEV